MENPTKMKMLVLAPAHIWDKSTDPQKFLAMAASNNPYATQSNKHRTIP
jgi:hypothetical protein